MHSGRRSVVRSGFGFVLCTAVPKNVGASYHDVHGHFVRHLAASVACAMLPLGFAGGITERDWRGILPSLWNGRERSVRGLFGCVQRDGGTIEML